MFDLRMFDCLSPSPHIRGARIEMSLSDGVVGRAKSRLTYVGRGLKFFLIMFWIRLNSRLTYVGRGLKFFGRGS